MSSGSPYLLIHRDEGYGEVFPLNAAQRYGMGRAPNNSIVIKDELASREHCEVYFADGQWHARDLGSLNGTRLNGQVLTRDTILAPQDEIRIGRTRLLYLEKMAGVPSAPPVTKLADQSVAIRKRLGDTRYQQPMDVTHQTSEGKAFPRERIEADLARLYQLALRMGEAESIEGLADIVLTGLLDAVPADVGAILTLRENKDLDTLAYKTRDPNQKTYHKISQFVSSEVLTNRQAILAEDVTTHANLSKRDSLAELKATSLICAPVRVEGQVFGLIHLYGSGAVRPLDAEDLEFVVAAATQFAVAVQALRKQSRLSAELTSLRDQLKVESELIGTSKPIADIVTQIGKVAGTNATALIRGESGVGKELVARAIHFNSPRREGPFICLNCAALTETLLESELFGHEKGAFTGATEKMLGKFEAADKGTIFLDEIGEMNVGTQAKLLRVLEGHSFERVGGNTAIKVDVRVVAATNQALELGVQAGKFRKDLFFRLQVVEFRVPPLRERLSDVPVLAEHFLKRFVRETGRKIRGFTPAAIKKMQLYQWPGNIRELKNVVERAVALRTGPMIDEEDVILSSLSIGLSGTHTLAYKERTIEDIERDHIKATLIHTEWNKSQAAIILGIERSTLDRKIKAYDLQK
jgi:transcriptional regulator with GAF, ATPase, and Fis domain